MSMKNKENSNEIRGLYYAIKDFKEELEKEYEETTTKYVDRHHVSTYLYLKEKYSELTNGYTIPRLQSVITYKEIIQKLVLMSSQLRAKMEDPEKEISNLKKENESLVKENKKLVKILENVAQTEDFKVTKEEIDSFPDEISELVLEAISSYKNACYVGCCMLCGKIFEFLVIRACKNLEEVCSSLSKGVEILSGAGKLKGEPYKNALEIAKFYRHKAVHSPNEKFDKNKAKYILSQLIFLNKEVFSKI
ncbi:MAG: hypothetical protein KAT49_04595 [Methanomicrobia archaeon]|nr:hypothetical protein [Methanomicrobia archaeon]